MINTILKTSQTILSVAGSHLLIDKVQYGSIDKIDDITVVNKTAWLHYQSSNVRNNTIEVSFNLIIIFRIEPFVEKYTDYLAGVNISFVYKIRTNYDTCNAPFDDSVISTNLDEYVTYVNKFLTCTNLSDCSTFSDLVERVVILEQGGTSSGLTCADLSGCTTIQNIELDITNLENNKVDNSTYTPFVEDVNTLITNLQNTKLDTSVFNSFQTSVNNSLGTKVPYTGATQDVDLGNNNLNAKGVKINGTNGNGHVGFKHQNSTPSAGGQETVLFANNSGNGDLYVKNDGNPIQRLLTDTDLTNINSNISSKVTANPSISGGTATKVTYDSQGLITSATNADTSDINDSTNRRYVTDAQRTVIQNTSGTNSGDETASSIRSKVGNASSSNTGVLSSTDWTTFNNKVDATQALTTISVLSAAVTVPSTTAATTVYTVTINTSQLRNRSKIMWDFIVSATGTANNKTWALVLNGTTTHSQILVSSNITVRTIPAFTYTGTQLRYNSSVNSAGNSSGIGTGASVINSISPDGSGNFVFTIVLTKAVATDPLILEAADVVLRY